jgi:hypothetical protein
VPDRRVVVVRYVQAPIPTPPPTPAPTAPPTLAPTAPPTLAPTAPPPTPAPRQYEHFIVGDYLVSPRTYNQFSPGNAKLENSYAGRAAFEFPVEKLPMMVEFDYRQFAYPHTGDYDGTPQNTPCTGVLAGNRGCVTNIGNGNGYGYVNSFNARDEELSGRLGVQVLNPRVYLAGAYIERTNNYGSPWLRGAGFGIEKLPDLEKSFSYFASYYYFPQLQGGQFDPSTGVKYDEEYLMHQYQAGIVVNAPFGIAKNTGVFFELGYEGDSLINKQFAPGNVWQSGGFAGIGIHF